MIDSGLRASLTWELPSLVSPTAGLAWIWADQPDAAVIDQPAPNLASTARSELQIITVR